jgi:aminopeptidase-like protein
MRSVWGTFPEYHTSADNLDFIRPAQLAKSLRVCGGIVELLENNRRYRNLNPYCEPQLGKRNLYRSTGGESIGTEINARLWVLNFSDGGACLLDIAERSGIPSRHRTGRGRLFRPPYYLCRMIEENRPAGPCLLSRPARHMDNYL